MLRRGEVRDYVVGSRQLRVLIVSSDDYTGPGMQRWGLVVTPRQADTRAAGRLLVTLGPGDPQRGQVVHIPLVLRIDASAVRTNYGFVTGDTMNAVERGLRAFLELP